MKRRPKADWRVTLTANGLGYLASTVVLFLFAVNYSSNLLFTLCFVLIGVMTVCFWLNIINIKGINELAVNVQSVHVGQLLEYKIDVIDEEKRSHLDLLANGRPVLDIERSQQQQWMFSVPADKRGLKGTSLLRIGSRWPLGLFYSTRNLVELPAVVIYPDISDAISPRDSVAGDEAHSHNDADNLVGLREYQPGDNARRIDWRAMARREQLQVKLFDGGSGDASAWLDWDDTQHLDYEQRIAVLCRWAIDYHKLGTEFGLRIPGFGAAPANSYHHLQQCLYQLSMMPHQQLHQPHHQSHDQSHHEPQR